MITLDALARELGCCVADLFDLGVLDADETRSAIAGAHPVGELLVPLPLAEKFRTAWIESQTETEAATGRESSTNYEDMPSGTESLDIAHDVTTEDLAEVEQALGEQR